MTEQVARILQLVSYCCDVNKTKIQYIKALFELKEITLEALKVTLAAIADGEPIDEEALKVMLKELNNLTQEEIQDVATAMKEFKIIQVDI